MSSQKQSFEGIGTVWEVEVYNTISHTDFDTLITNIQSLITEFDNRYSRFIPTSFVHDLTKKKGVVEVGEEFTQLLLYYIPLFKLTNGLFTPTVGTLLEQIGYDMEYSFTPKETTPVPDFLKAIEILDEKTLRINEPVLLDFGAIGKGFLIDLVTELLLKKGITHANVDAGGDIRTIQSGATNKPLTIGLEHPDNQKMIIGTCSLINGAICGSAGNRRTWGTYHHIVNPLTHLSPKNVKAVWTVAANAALADGLSTCLFLVPPDVLLKQFQFEYVLLFVDGTVRVSKHFPGKLFT